MKSECADIIVKNIEDMDKIVSRLYFVKDLLLLSKTGLPKGFAEAIHYSITTRNALVVMHRRLSSNEDLSSTYPMEEFKDCLAEAQLQEDEREYIVGGRDDDTG